MATRPIQHAIVRPPGTSFAAGITTAGLGAPDLALALRQHRAYCGALRRCGVEVEVLDPDDRYPDSTFIEDTAVIVPSRVVLTRPGAASRAGEVEATAAALSRRFPRLDAVAAPGTVDGGDVCETPACVLIGISARTNLDGARSLASLLSAAGIACRTVDIRDSGMLHLKSGLSDLGDGRLLVAAALAGRAELTGFEQLAVDDAETYAANAVLVNDRVLVAAGNPRTETALRRLGYSPLALEMSEFRKMDGGLSCLSLRY